MLSLSFPTAKNEFKGLKEMERIGLSVYFVYRTSNFLSSMMLILPSSPPERM